MKAQELTAEYVRECVQYDPDSGEFTWKVRPTNHFKDESYRDRWNNRYSGLLTGQPGSNGYLRISIDNNKYYSHRLAWLITHSEWPTHIDHIDGCRVNNRISNLRSVSRSENQRNLKMGTHNTSGHLGVTTDRRTGKYIAQIKVRDKHIHLGVFDVLSDAVEARKAANIKYGFHQNHGRIVEASA